MKAADMTHLLSDENIRTRRETMTRTCATCKWRSDEYTSVCVNDESDHLADFVEASQSCPVWEAKEADANDTRKECSE